MTGNTRGKRGDPNYKLISAYIPKELALRFKMICAATEVDQSQAMEEMITIWTQQKQSVLSKIVNSEKT